MAGRSTTSRSRRIDLALIADEEVPLVDAGISTVAGVGPSTTRGVANLPVLADVDVRRREIAGVAMPRAVDRLPCDAVAAPTTGTSAGRFAV